MATFINRYLRDWDDLKGSTVSLRQGSGTDIGLILHVGPPQNGDAYGKYQ